jgi:multidrug transporter EmrE-like cation transporter
MPKTSDHAFLFMAIALNGLSQMIMRWQMGGETLPESLLAKIPAAMKLLLRPWVLVAVGVSFTSAVSWMIALTKFELSYAYPFTAALYVYMLGAGFLLFGEALTPMRIIGTAVIVLGVVMVAL